MRANTSSLATHGFSNFLSLFLAHPLSVPSPPSAAFPSTMAFLSGPRHELLRRDPNTDDLRRDYRSPGRSKDRRREAVRGTEKEQRIATIMY